MLIQLKNLACCPVLMRRRLEFSEVKWFAPNNKDNDGAKQLVKNKILVPRKQRENSGRGQGQNTTWDLMLSELVPLLRPRFEGFYLLHLMLTNFETMSGWSIDEIRASIIFISSQLLDSPATNQDLICKA